jgi:hypothetical protein
MIRTLTRPGARNRRLRMLLVLSALPWPPSRTAAWPSIKTLSTTGHDYQHLRMRTGPRRT